MDDIITQGSKELLAQGVRVLQGNRFASTEREHLKRLVAYMNLKDELISVADMGCGFGAVSCAMSDVIPDSNFWLINNNRFQLKQCPLGIRFVECPEDMCSTSIPDNTVDFVMFNYSICHVDHEKALVEAARIAKPGARLFIYDYARTFGDNELAETYLFSRFISDQEFRGLCGWIGGWKNIETIYPGGDDILFRRAMNNDFLYDAIFEDLEPVIWKAQL